jgi:hypothetical protein
MEPASLIDAHRDQATGTGTRGSGVSAYGIRDLSVCKLGTFNGMNHPAFGIKVFLFIGFIRSSSYG